MGRLDEIMARENENWKDVPDYEGYYQVSNMGRVRSLDRIVEYAGYRKQKRFYEGTILKPSNRSKYGHKCVSLRKCGKSKIVGVHNLVANAFLPTPSSTDVLVRHLNGNATDNRAVNLAWGDCKENEADKALHGRALIGEKNLQSKLTDEKVSTIKELLRYGMKGKNIARVFGECNSTICDINRGKGWKHVV